MFSIPIVRQTENATGFYNFSKLVKKFVGKHFVLLVVSNISLRGPNLNTSTSLMLEINASGIFKVAINSKYFRNKSYYVYYIKLLESYLYAFNHHTYNQVFASLKTVLKLNYAKRSLWRMSGTELSQIGIHLFICLSTSFFDGRLSLQIYLQKLVCANYINIRVYFTSSCAKQLSIIKLGSYIVFSPMSPNFLRLISISVEHFYKLFAY